MKTMRDVAERAGVSATTVSLVLNGRQPVGGAISGETRERVLSAAKELGYRRNALVQAVVSGRNKALGFLGPTVTHEFTARLLSGVLEVAATGGYSVQILQLQNTSVAQQAFELCLEMRLAGLVLVDPDKEALDYLHAELKPHGVLLAFLDTSFRADWGIHVATDDMQGVRLAIEHLYGLGHRRIAYLGGSAGRGMANVRAEAYRMAMAEHGLVVPAEYVREGGWGSGHSKAQEQALELLSLQQRPTAICCASDDIAIAVQRVARRIGLQMPLELSVVGFANAGSALLADPLLTTVAQPAQEMGRVAAQHLIEQLEAVSKNGEDGERNKAVEEILPTHLVVRESTAPPPLAPA